MTAAITTEVLAGRWVARGTTDEVTDCEHCGKADLKTTVRMVVLDSDGNEDGETYMGVVCAARMTGRRAAEIRTEAARADRVAYEARWAVYSQWRDALSDWSCATRDAALGKGALPTAILAFFGTDEFKAAKAAWIQANPEPVHP